MSCSDVEPAELDVVRVRLGGVGSNFFHTLRTSLGAGEAATP